MEMQLLGLNSTVNHTDADARCTLTLMISEAAKKSHNNSLAEQNVKILCKIHISLFLACTSTVLLLAQLFTGGKQDMVLFFTVLLK